jgi:hypothetical protein
VNRDDLSAAFVRVAASVTVLASVAMAAGRQGPEFASQTEIVTVDVVVLDGSGHPVSGLGASDFVVMEDGKPQVELPSPAAPTTR